MRLGPWKVEAELGHLALIILIAVVTLFYLSDTLQVSRNTNNIILVVPLTLLILGLCLLVVTQCVRFRRLNAIDDSAIGESDSGQEAPDEFEQEQSPVDLLRAFMLLLGVGVLVAVYPVIGLDTATLFFMVFALLLLGVRGWVFVPAYAAIFTFVVVGGASWLLPYPFATLLL
jgi:uncharacterized membrane protein YhaH (DUF805 family)